MRVVIETDASIIEPEIIIKCREVNDRVLNLQKSILKSEEIANMVFFKNNVEYFLSPEKILFFETGENIIVAHTENDMFYTKTTLSALEKDLPSYFMRISKSSIVNCKHINSIEKRITSFSMAGFENSVKHVSVSRNYLKLLLEKIANIN